MGADLQVQSQERFQISLATAEDATSLLQLLLPYFTLQSKSTPASKLTTTSSMESQPAAASSATRQISIHAAAMTPPIVGAERASTQNSSEANSKTPHGPLPATGPAIAAEIAVQTHPSGLKASIDRGHDVVVDVKKALMAGYRHLPDQGLSKVSFEVAAQYHRPA
jgi:hypothetical protein